jgi:hypothetical protein
MATLLSPIQKRLILLWKDLNLKKRYSMIRVYNTILDDLEKASSYERQKYEWLDNEEDIISSYTEDYYSLFWGVMFDYERSDVVFGPEIDNALKNLHAMMAAIDEYELGTETILNMPEMVVVREEAARIAKMLRETPNEGVTFQWISPGEKK